MVDEHRGISWKATTLYSDEQGADCLEQPSEQRLC